MRSCPKLKCWVPGCRRTTQFLWHLLGTAKDILAPKKKEALAQVKLLSQSWGVVISHGLYNLLLQLNETTHCESSSSSSSAKGVYCSAQGTYGGQNQLYNRMYNEPVSNGRVSLKGVCVPSVTLRKAAAARRRSQCY